MLEVIDGETPAPAKPDAAPRTQYTYDQHAAKFTTHLQEDDAAGMRPAPDGGGSAQSSPGVLFGKEPGDKNAISPDDIHQNQLGDCYFDSSLGELAKQDPNAIRNMIHDNGNGTYTVTLHRQDNGLHNLWGFFGNDYTTQKITVTPNVPSSAINQQSPDPVSVHGQRELWPQLIEEAYAKQNGGYDKIGKGGYANQAMESLTGHDASNIGMNDYGFDRLRSDLNGGKLVVLSTQPNSGSNPFGLVTDHSYMVMGTSTDSHGRQLVTLRNPWGQGTSDGMPVTITAPYSQIQKYMMYASVGSTH